jgi:hypothetical protein
LCGGELPRKISVRMGLHPSLGNHGVDVLALESEGSGEGIFSKRVGHEDSCSGDEQAPCKAFGYLLQGHCHTTFCFLSGLE